MVQERLIFLKAKSLNDVCRRACGVDKASIIFLYKKQGNNLLVASGEKLNDVSIAYYFPVNEIKRYVLYYLDPEKQEEKVEFADKIEDTAAIASDTRCSLAVVQADFSKIEAKASKAKIPSVKLGSLLDMARLFVKKAVQEEALPIAYVYNYSGKSVFGTFNLISELEDEVSTFYYTFAEDDGKSAFIRYDYKEDSVSLTNDTESHAFFYIKLVRLGEKIPVLIKT